MMGTQSTWGTCPIVTMFQILYGSTAAGLYDQAAKLNAQARTLYLQSSDTYYKANDGLKNSDSDVEEGRRKVLRDLEQKTGFVTLETWKRYELALKRRDACEGPLPFETYLASIKAERQKAEKVVEEWTKSKDEEEKLRKE